MFDYGNPDSSSLDLARTIDELVESLTAPRAPRDHGYSYVKPHKTVTPLRDTVVVPLKDTSEFTREEWLAWYEEEFAGYATDEDPDSFVLDEGSMVSQWQVASDTATAAYLDRDERSCYRTSPDGSRSVKGEHPFSTDEGAAEWLGRVRIELRDAYRRAGSDRERSAIVAREAALRARHNARCWARACARYYGVDENLALSLLNLYQRLAPIGWLGIEAEMKDAWLDAERHFESSTERWDAAFESKWSQPEYRAEREAWLDRMPVRPEHPTQLVTSTKKLRPYAEVVREQTTAEVAPVLSKAERERRREEQLVHAKAVLLKKLRAERLRKVYGVRPLPKLDPLATAEWYDLRKEWERAEMIETERLDVPEFLPMHNLQGDLERDFARLTERIAQYHADAVVRSAHATRYLSTAA